MDAKALGRACVVILISASLCPAVALGAGGPNGCIAHDFSGREVAYLPVPSFCTCQSCPSGSGRE